MAALTVKAFKRLDKSKNTVHDPVQTTYTVFQEDEKTVLQIDTYGRADRTIPGKVSQSIQIDKEAAKLLYNLLKKTFDLKE